MTSLQGTSKKGNPPTRVGGGGGTFSMQKKIEDVLLKDCNFSRSAYEKALMQAGIWGEGNFIHPVDLSALVVCPQNFDPTSASLQETHIKCQFITGVSLLWSGLSYDWLMDLRTQSLSALPRAGGNSDAVT